ncbi:hypothetical protein KP509_21G087100 [Ceratopteris richardii]|nr:hypothetical protein KP509_21G087100 [Ceratopteris richardii]
MQPAPEMLHTLSNCFLQTLAPNPEPRKLAENYLKQAAEQDGYGLAVLRLLTEQNVDDQVRQAAAVNFKNHVKYRWAPANSDLSAINEAEKDQIKALVVNMMLSAPPKIQSQLSEALAIISKHDFPKKWGSLLPELVTSLKNAGSDYSVTNGVLQTVNSIFKQFRYLYKSAELYVDLKYCLDEFAAPLLEIFVRTSQLIGSNAQSPNVLKPLFECQRLCCRIFYSLNYQELPEFFEDNMKQWMSLFHDYLVYENPLLKESRDDKESVLDQVKAAVCENINLYMEKNEEEFKDYLPGFAADIWGLLMKVSLSSSHDRLAMTAIKFLTTVSKSVHHNLFNQPDALKQICESIVIPNVELRDDDEELFEMNQLEYIRRDMEGSDIDTRRRVACELVKGLSTYFSQEVNSMFSAYVRGMMDRYSTNPLQNWKSKDCALFLVTALAPKQIPGSATGSSLVDIDQFFATAILPELQCEDVNSQPILKADAIKFVTTFRVQLPKQVSLTLIPHLARFLLSESNVVHSYSALCIERMLIIRDGKQLRFGAQDLAPFMSVLLNNLFAALKLPESQENVYVMKCIMRVLSNGDIAQYATNCLDQLVNILSVLYKNPSNPTFSHYLFEAIAALVRRSCEKSPELVGIFEVKLFPVFQDILALDVIEFAPYVFQIMAQLIDTRNPPLPPTYIGLFPHLLTPVLWQRSANVPALVRLLQSYLQRASGEIIQAKQLEPVLGVFEKLINSKNTDHHGFFIINTVVEYLDYQVLSNYVTGIWNLLFMRLQTHRTGKFIKSLIVFMSLFCVKYGHDILVESIQNIQQGLFLTIIQTFWVPHLLSITGDIEVKLCAVASTKLLCESPVLQTDAAIPVWGKLLNSLITLLIRPEEERVEDEGDVPDLDEMVGYTAVYAQLYNAGKKEEDPVKEVQDAKQLLVISLAKLSSCAPGKFPAIIQQSVEPANQAGLAQFCNTYNCSIV